jgi:hypothetical protein
MATIKSNNNGVRSGAFLMIDSVDTLNSFPAFTECWMDAGKKHSRQQRYYDNNENNG